MISHWSLICRARTCPLPLPAFECGSMDSRPVESSASSGMKWWENYSKICEILIRRIMGKRKGIYKSSNSTIPNWTVTATSTRFLEACEGLIGATAAGGVTFRFPWFSCSFWCSNDFCERDTQLWNWTTLVEIVGLCSFILSNILVCFLSRERSVLNPTVLHMSNISSQN